MPTKRYKSARAAAQFDKKKKPNEDEASPPRTSNGGALDQVLSATIPKDPTPIATALALNLSDTTTPFLPQSPPSNIATPIDSGTELPNEPPTLQLSAPTPTSFPLSEKNAAFFNKWLPRFHAYISTFPTTNSLEPFPSFCHAGLDLLIAFTRDVTKEHIAKKGLPHDEMLTPPGAPVQETVFTNPFYAGDKVKNFLDVNFERWRLTRDEGEELQGVRWEDAGEEYRRDVEGLLERVEGLCEVGTWERVNRKVRELKREGRFGEKYRPKDVVKEEEDLEGEGGDEVGSGEEGDSEGEKVVVAVPAKKGRGQKKKSKVAEEGVVSEEPVGGAKEEEHSCGCLGCTVLGDGEKIDEEAREGGGVSVPDDEKTTKTAKENPANEQPFDAVKLGAAARALREL
ncbi:unnamed protein product [Zymoseptoria tritici ST99CH_1A5]|uniref:Uncharacterized protein n=2 Tax=Zymoseptoria tritici TaxID=1047171 RepID=F9XQ95_ZYMTI|nr:uncharacterized protein MYCGRDRAFT_97455 [Zymoseptoria tritici IPO323]EGP82601.1 hypothetical protein MYCGRDRAFT_97455 [Zymoseptoria tritici IPO323]SMY29933.1 unnamed protein product [Zymoseptoria tritici ST99CH_1A5]